MSVILITAIGSFSGDIVIKNFKRGGHRVVGCDIYPAEWVADSLSVDRFAQAPLSTDESKYVPFLLQLCEAEGVDYLVPLTDPEVDVLSERHEEFKKRGVIVCAPGPEVVRLCRDKFALPTFLKEKGILNTIPTRMLREVGDGKNIQYPMITKPRCGRSSKGCFQIHDKLDFDYIRAKQQDEDDFILQPFLKWPLTTVDVVRQSSSQTTVSIPRREFLRTPSGAGTTVEVFYDEKLERLCHEIAALTGIIGTVNFEFLEAPDGQFHLLEINPRFSAGVEFSCLAGYDMVTSHLDCFNGKTIPAPTAFQQLVVARKYEEFITKRGLSRAQR